MAYGLDVLENPKVQDANPLSAESIDKVRIGCPADVRRAAEALHKQALAFGMRAAPAHDIADKRTPVDADGNILARDVFGWNDEKVWWRNSRIALDSPLTSACRFESEPFWVNAQGFRTRQPNHYLAAIDLTNFDNRAMTRAAIVVPVHLPFGQIGAVSFNPLDPTVTDLEAAFLQHGDAFGIYARTFIASYVHAMGSVQALPPGSRLSKREVECLRWAAIGKTDLEISMIMSRSRATVRFHIHNASTKLNAVNRSQTVFKAAQLGYISLNT
ncbi:LuxR C-terminal-related transcriptional regulator [Novosphingobium sp. FKTRR1]|uniref:helix-turn-helix transcriptional regulator n=1 Tax=unclassified Novosphingobium TaxID=2644732 RepID=UPI001CF07910|nr:LuxR C-terminal-related transcriptional regulator [Novosphingobium sp. FKTRR1]